MLSGDTVLYVVFAATTLSLTLYFTLLMKLKPSKEVKLSAYIEPTAIERSSKKNRRAEKRAREIQKARETSASGAGNSEERDCLHYVGYLTTLPKGSPFPDECFGCRKVIQCLRIEPSGVIESFYVQPAEAARET